jgi:hypothetical protein
MNSEAAARRLWSRPCGKLGGGGVAGKNSGGNGSGVVIVRFQRTVENQP